MGSIRLGVDERRTEVEEQIDQNGASILHQEHLCETKKDGSDKCDGTNEMKERTHGSPSNLRAQVSKEDNIM